MNRVPIAILIVSFGIDNAHGKLGAVRTFLITSHSKRCLPPKIECCSGLLTGRLFKSPKGLAMHCCERKRRIRIIQVINHFSSLGDAHSMPYGGLMHHIPEVHFCTAFPFCNCTHCEQEHICIIITHELDPFVKYTEP